jgi:hypothetical protein
VGANGAVSGGAVQLTISCARMGACAGELEIDATGAHANKQHQKKPKLVLLAKGSYSVPARTTLTIGLALTKKGRALLKMHHGKLATTLKITPTGGKTTTQTLKLVQKKGARARAGAGA